MSNNPLWDGVREGCGTCAFGGPLPKHKSLQCRRYPPVLLVVSYTHIGDQVEPHQPWMMEGDWCGEYKRKARP